MEQSRIQFDMPVLIKCEYTENSDVQQGISDISINIENKYKKDADNNIANVKLDVKVGEKNNRSPFYINVIFSANFKWENEITNPDDFLNVNAPALLYSYVRPIVSSLVSNTKFVRFDLPFMDFSSIVKKSN